MCKLTYDKCEHSIDLRHQLLHSVPEHRLARDCERQYHLRALCTKCIVVRIEGINNKSRMEQLARREKEAKKPERMEKPTWPEDTSESHAPSMIDNLQGMKTDDRTAQRLRNVPTTKATWYPEAGVLSPEEAQISDKKLNQGKSGQLPRQVGSNDYSKDKGKELIVPTPPVQETQVVQSQGSESWGGKRNHQNATHPSQVRKAFQDPQYDYTKLNWRDKELPHLPQDARNEPHRQMCGVPVSGEQDGQTSDLHARSSPMSERPDRHPVPHDNTDLLLAPIERGSEAEKMDSPVSPLSSPLKWLSGKKTSSEAVADEGDSLCPVSPISPLGETEIESCKHSPHHDHVGVARKVVIHSPSTTPRHSVRARLVTTRQRSGSARANVDSIMSELMEAVDNSLKDWENTRDERSPESFKGSRRDGSKE